MKGELNNGLQPPEKRELDFENDLNKWLEYIKIHLTISDVFDTYNHDREVAQNFHNWFEVSGWMDATIINDGLKIGEYFINTSVYTQDRLTFEQLWEIYCTETKQ